MKKYHTLLTTLMRYLLDVGKCIIGISTFRYFISIDFNSLFIYMSGKKYFKMFEKYQKLVEISFEAIRTA